MDIKSKLKAILESEFAMPENDDDLESVRVEDANRSKANTGILFSIKKVYYTWKKEFNLKKSEMLDKKIDKTSDKFINSDNYSDTLVNEAALELQNLKEKKEETEDKINQAQSKLDELNASVETPASESVEETTKVIPDLEVNPQQIEQSLENYADEEVKDEKPVEESKSETQEEIKPMLQETSKKEETTESEIVELKKQHEKEKQQINEQFQIDLSNLITSYIKNSIEKESDFYGKSFDLIYAQANNLVAGLKKDLQNEKSKNGMLKANLDKSEKMIQNQDATIKEQASAINGLNDSIAAKEKENAALRLEIEKKDSTIKSLNGIVRGFQALNMVETEEYTTSNGKTK